MALLPRLLSGLLLAPVVSAGPVPNEVSVGVATFGYSSFFRPTPRVVALELAYERSLGTAGLGRAVRVGAGLRASTPGAGHVPLPLEGFARLQLAARYGPWQPAVGPELGVTGFSRLQTTQVYPQISDLFNQEQARLGPVYLAFDMVPLAFHFSRFNVSALEFQFGTTLRSPGTAIRFQVLFARVGVSL